jgi:hypothetical protein
MYTRHVYGKCNLYRDSIYVCLLYSAPTLKGVGEEVNIHVFLSLANFTALILTPTERSRGWLMIW